jgi:hypothetical protein
MKKIILLILLAVPSFALMLRQGIYTTHDFHPFRQYEFDRCIQDKIFPCRWAADSGMGYGEPVFNFYGQFPYWVGELYHLVGFSLIDSVKLVFITSLICSGIFMYLFSREHWGNWGGLLSAVFYIYAPYRAVDVWVRGALPEALAFTLFPLILYFLHQYLKLHRRPYLLGFILSVSALIITHNLSAFMFLPFLAAYYFYISWSNRSWPALKAILPAGLVSLVLVAFYLLPVIFESRFTTLARTTADYYMFQNHFATLNQLFISRFWGYGGSTWGPNDTMSFSVGYLHWVLPLAVVAFLLVSRRLRSAISIRFLFFAALGLFAVFLTHGKSEIIWKIVPGMPYVQFPWRFLSVVDLFLSLSVGVIPLLWPKFYRPLVFLLIVAVITLNYPFFRPDIWRPINDAQQYSGALWDEQRASSLQDYWPSFAAKQPVAIAPELPQFIGGSGEIIAVRKQSQSARYDINTVSESNLIFSTVYFPGWTARLDGQPLEIGPSGDLALITARVPAGSHNVRLIFSNTPVRDLGNWISLVTLLGLLIWNFLPKHAKT